MLRRKLFVVPACAVMLLLALLVVAQLVVPAQLQQRVRREALAYVPRADRDRARVETSAPFPAALVLLGSSGGVSISTPAMRVPQETSIFRLVHEASSVRISALALRTDYVTLQDLRFRADNGRFVLRAGVGADELSRQLGSVYATAGVTRVVDNKIVLGDGADGQAFLNIAPRGLGHRLVAFVTVAGADFLGHEFTLISDPHMHVDSVTIIPQAHGWLLIITGNTV